MNYKKVFVYAVAIIVGVIVLNTVYGSYVASRAAGGI